LLVRSLLVLTLFLLIWLWKRMTPELRAYGVTSLILLATIFVSTRDTPSGAATSPGAIAMFNLGGLAALIAVPLLMRYRAALTGERLGKTIWFAGCLLIAVSLLIQLASLAFCCRSKFTKWKRWAIRRL